MSGCISCGVELPEGQRTCSVCYGDPFHGRDGILMGMMEEDFRRQEAEDAWCREHEAPPQPGGA